MFCELRSRFQGKKLAFSKNPHSRNRIRCPLEEDTGRGRRCYFGGFSSFFLVSSFLVSSFLVSSFLVSSFLVSSFLVSSFLVSSFLVSSFLVSSFLVSSFLVSFLVSSFLPVVPPPQPVEITSPRAMSRARSFFMD